MKYVLIGGGENGHDKTPYETGKADRSIVELTNKEHPRLLFIGWANDQEDKYYEVIKRIYERLGCECKRLEFLLHSNTYLNESISWADIIYVGGGSTDKLMTMFKLIDFKSKLIAYGKEDVICSGVSAGANCWCDAGNSCEDGISHNTSGLGLVDIIIYPHIVRDLDMRFQHFLDSIYNAENRQKNFFLLDKSAVIFDDKGKMVKALIFTQDGIVEKKYWNRDTLVSEKYTDESV